MPGEPKDFLAKRAEAIGFTADYKFEAFPVVFWDLFGKEGHPDPHDRLRDRAAALLARSSTSTTPRRASSTSPSSVADDEGLLLLDLKDLQALLTYVAERASDLTTRYGNVSKATIGTVQRSLLVLEQQGADAVLRRAGARHQRR